MRYKYKSNDHYVYVDDPSGLLRQPEGAEMITDEEWDHRVDTAQQAASEPPTPSLSDLQAQLNQIQAQIADALKSQAT